MNSVNNDSYARAAAKLQAEAHEAITAAREKQADAMVQLIRERLAKFNLRSHRVFIRAHMGSVGLVVYRSDRNLGLQKRNSRYRFSRLPDGTSFTARTIDVCDLRGGERSEVVAVLQEIDQMLCGVWDWAQYAHNRFVDRD